MFDRYRKIQQERADGEEGGFTLIELLIVIVVLGILAAVTVFALGGVTSQSAQASCNADAKSAEVAVEAYRAQTGSFPTLQSQITGASYLRTWPSNAPHYAVTLGAAGAVMVAVPASGTPANYDSANPCASAT